LRLRITLVFTAVMAPILATTGFLLYGRFGADLDSTIDNGLRSRAADVTALIRESDSGFTTERLPDRAESFAEILDPQGRILDATPQLRGYALLGAAEQERAGRGPILLDRPPNHAMPYQSRLLATPVQSNGRRLIVVVGTSTETREDSLSDLLGLLLIGGPIALLLASLAAYGGAAAALRPVDAMRARAAEISAAEPDQRLPVPPSNDEIGRLGVTLNQMLERLGGALEHERRFVADASHELRTPLAILKTEIELALEQGRTREELTAALASAAEEADRLTQLAEDLLVLAQTDRGKLPMAREDTEMRSVLEGTVQRFARRAADHQRRLEVSCEEDLHASVDRLRLEQALGNLVDNSLRYGAGTIELRAVMNDNRLEIHVADRGPGFPAAFLGHAFERFSRVQHSNATGGAGLGMAIAQSIAQAHGGEAYAGNRSGAGGGADVWLSLPMERRQALPKHSRVAERVTPRLRVDAESVRAVANRDARK